MSNRKPFTKLQRVSDYAATGVQEFNGRRLTCIQIFAAKFSQSDPLLHEIRFMERHEVWMDVPTMRVGLVLPAKNRAGETMMRIELVGGETQPHWVDRMRIRVEQHDVLMPGVLGARFRGLAVTMPAPAWFCRKHSNVRLGPKPFAGPVATA